VEAVIALEVRADLQLLFKKLRVESEPPWSASAEWNWPW
jgi:hypothetical protein